MLDKELIELVNEEENNLKEEFTKIDKDCERNSLKVLEAFKNNKISETHFNGTTGYGCNDAGRDAIENVYCRI